MYRFVLGLKTFGADARRSKTLLGECRGSASACANSNFGLKAIVTRAEKTNVSWHQLVIVAKPRCSFVCYVVLVCGLWFAKTFTAYCNVAGGT